MKLRIIVGESPSQTAALLGRALMETTSEALDRRGRAALALSGGETPRTLHAFLTGPGRRGNRWAEADFFFADERMVAPQHPWSNYGLAERELFHPLGLSGPRLHRILGELPEAALAADTYDTALREWLPDRTGGTSFDVALLGLGPDGHTASLFPGRTEGEAALRRAVAVATPPVPPAVPRVSVTYSTLSSSRKLFFLVTGAAKQAIVAKVLGDPGAAASLPAARLHAQEEVVWYLDRAAAGLLPGAPSSAGESALPTASAGL